MGKHLQPTIKLLMPDVNRKWGLLLLDPLISTGKACWVRKISPSSFTWFCNKPTTIISLDGVYFKKSYLNMIFQISFLEN